MCSGEIRSASIRCESCRTKEISTSLIRLPLDRPNHDRSPRSGTPTRGSRRPEVRLEAVSIPLRSAPPGLQFERVDHFLPLLAADLDFALARLFEAQSLVECASAVVRGEVDRPHAFHVEVLEVVPEPFV